MYERIGGFEIAFFAFILFFSFLGLCLFFYLRFLRSRQSLAVSPYTKLPLRAGAEIPWHGAEKILRYLYHLHQFENRIFDIKRASFCRATGRIFPKTVTWHGTIEVDWTFLEKRHPGHWVSWGSLDLNQQREIREAHAPIEGFQDSYSCPDPSPRAVSDEFAWRKPGPLYVDLETKTLLGWKCVPETEFEVLIVQKPVEFIYPTLPEKENNHSKGIT